MNLLTKLCETLQQGSWVWNHELSRRNAAYSSEIIEAYTKNIHDDISIYSLITIRKQCNSKARTKKVQNRNSCTTITDISPIILSSRKTKARRRSQLSNILQWLVVHSTSVFRQTFASKFLDIYICCEHRSLTPGNYPLLL